MTKLLNLIKIGVELKMQSRKSLKLKKETVKSFCNGSLDNLEHKDLNMMEGGALIEVEHCGQHSCTEDIYRFKSEILNSKFWCQTIPDRWGRL